MLPRSGGRWWLWSCRLQGGSPPLKGLQAPLQFLQQINGPTLTVFKLSNHPSLYFSRTKRLTPRFAFGRRKGTCVLEKGVYSDSQGPRTMHRGESWPLRHLLNTRCREQMRSLPSLRGLWFVALWCRRSPQLLHGEG